MANYHTVAQGEHLSSIAKKYGFSTYKTIWDHGQNADLKSKRQNPNVIFPGDRLFIPDKIEKIEARGTEAKHRFELKTEKLRLRLVLEDQYEKPIANAPCELHIENDIRHVTSDGQGKIEQEIPSNAERARLIIRSKETSLDDLILPINIGHLDPVDEITGQQARLSNLGYYTGPVDGQENDDLRLAVEEFQCDHNLFVDGKCGGQTQAKLKDVHGC
jgi:putative peptidoglycan binding protein/LysM domain-containing protein